MLFFPLFFISLLTFAQTLTCSDEELSQKCYAEICHKSSAPKIPLTTAGLEKELLSQKFDLPPAYKKILTDAIADEQVILKKTQEFYQSAKASDLVANYLNQYKYAQNHWVLELLLSSKIVPAFYQGKRLFIISNLEGKNADVYRRIADYFTDVEDKKVTDHTYIQKDLEVAMTVYIEEQKTKAPSIDKEKIMRSCGLTNLIYKKVKARNIKAEFNANRDAILQGMKTKFLPKLSAHSRTAINQEMPKDLFQSPKVSGDFYPDFKEMQETVSKLKGLDLTVDNYFNKVQSTRDLDSFKNFQCESSFTIPDDNYQENVIHTSPFTAILGYKDALSHELGHWVSERMGETSMSKTSKEKFLTLRACVKGFYPNAKPQKSPAHAGDLYTTEEDFADWFSATIYASGKTSLDCDLAVMIPTIETYLSGKSSGSTKDLYSAPGDGNHHSSDLFREINFSVQTGKKLSASCQELLGRHPDAGPKKCEL